jgi:hypothetical protein
MAANATLGVDGVVRRPILVVERTPDGIAVVDGDRVVNAQIVHGAPHVGLVLFERKLRRVYSDDRETVIPVALVPGS